MSRCTVIFSLMLTHLGMAQYTNIEPPHRLGGEVNSAVEESFPIFSKESSLLYFTRSFDSSSIGGYNDQDIWTSEMISDKTYNKGVELHALNNKFNNCIVGFNSDETIVYLLNAYHGKKDLKKGIAYAKKNGNKWGDPHDLAIPELDIEGNFYGFHINQDENTIVISYLGDNSEGQEDLYYSQLVDGTWSAPVTMGPNVNSSGYEISPFLSKNSDTLYFSSDGFGGYGNADIFYSIRTGESWSDWSEPINIGEMINSEKFDAYFATSGQFFYWSSNRESERSDIYYSSFIPPPPLFASAIGTDVTVYQGIDGRIDLTPSGGVEPYSYLWSNGSKIEDPMDLVKGVYSVVVTDKINQKVQLEVTINEPGPDPVSEVIEVETEPIETLFYFDLNSSYHNLKNKEVLNEFVANFSSKEGVKLSVVSHCDRRDTETYNVWLSKKRMNRTIDYLVDQGFNRALITGDYRGETQPDILCDSCTEDQFTKNRRTVVKVIQ